MNYNMIIGLLPFLLLAVVGYLMLKGKPPIFRMFLAMLAIALGYLGLTGALEDIGAKITGRMATNVAPAAVERAAQPEPVKTEAAAPAKVETKPAPPAEPPPAKSEAPAAPAPAPEKSADAPAPADAAPAAEGEPAPAEAMPDDTAGEPPPAPEGPADAAPADGAPADGQKPPAD